MKLTYDQVREMNDVQLDILKAFINVCKSLNLRYYMVHGSLLGTYTRGSFFPFDDDIDIAMPRKDYNVLMRVGNDYIADGYFVQSCITEPDFPLAFGKIRKTDTAFIQPIYRNLNINMGIFIDVFPIDNYPDNPIKAKAFSLMEAILRARISTRFCYDEQQPIWRMVSRFVAILITPSWGKAVKKRAELYKAVKDNEGAIVIGGKLNERGIPWEWFGEGDIMNFEDIPVTIPLNADAYLTSIYGKYRSYNPVYEYMNEDGTLTVSADTVDTHKSYLSYRS